jgi:autotransporter-associated beta strand protein
MGFAVHAAACVALLFAGPLPSAEAQTRKTWNVATGDWSTAGSWNTSGAPSGTTEVAVFEGTNLTLTATGNATPSIGQLYFNNSGTTTLQVNRITLNSGTGIIVTANSGNVFISNTSIGTSSNNPVIIQAAQIWENNSTSGTLSVQTALVGSIQNAPGLTLRGPGAFRLGALSGTGMLTYEGTGLLTLTGGNGGSFTLNSSGTVRNESNVNTFLASNLGWTTYRGGAIQQVGTGTALSNFRLDGGLSLVSGTLWIDNKNLTGTVASNSIISVSNDSLLYFGNPAGNEVHIRGTGQITKNGFGAMSLSRVNGTLFSGGFKLEEGLLVVEVAPNTHPGQASLGTGTFTIAGGTISSGRGQGSQFTQPSRFEGNFTVGGTAVFNLGSGTVTLGVDNPTINVVDPAVTFRIGGPIVGGANGLTKSGPGRMILTGSSTYTGLTTISSGSLWLGYGKNDAEGGTTGSVGGDIANNAMLVFNHSNAQTYGGVISGSGNLTKLLNTTTLTLNGVNTFSGTTTVTGAISLGNASALQNSGIDTAGAGTITAPSVQSSLTIGGLIGSKNFTSVFNTTNLNVTSVTLNPQAGRSFSYSGVIPNGTGGAATRTLTKTGAGEQILSGLNTYTGLTTVSAGRLTIASGSINTSSGVTVNGASAEFRYNSATAFNKTLTLTQGILSGTGTIQTAVTVGSNAIISPGNSPGSQTYDSSVWQAGGTYLWELNAQTGTPGTNWDRVVVTNALNLTALSASSKFNINLTTLTGSNTNGPLDTAWTTTGTSIFPFVSYGSLLLSGTFLNTADSDLTALFNFNLDNWLGTPKPQANNISVKVNSTGNGLNLVIVPEPATIALAGIGIGTAVWFFRRRRTA